MSTYISLTKPSGYSPAFVRKMVAIQEPLKNILRKVGKKSVSLRDVIILYKLLKDIQWLSKQEKEEFQDPNTAILFDTWNDMKPHFNKSFLLGYESILDPVFNFAALKIDYDTFYNGVFKRFFGELLRRGYQFPEHNRPSDHLWYKIPPETKERLIKSFDDNYSLYLERCKTIDEKFGESEESLEQKVYRLELCKNRILADFEREVVAWEM